MLVVVSGVPALAGPFEDAVTQFANDSFSDTEAAVGAVATSGNPLAFPIIDALADGRLLADPQSKKVYIKDKADGKVIDAATGEAAAAPSASAVRLNNRLRRGVEAALGGLTLLSPDPARRIQAAQSVFKIAHDAALPADRAPAEGNRQRRKPPLPKRRPRLFCSPKASEADKLDASVGDPRARRSGGAGAADWPVLRSVVRAGSRTSAAAISSIQSALAIWATAQNAWYGLSLGSVLLLAAIGLAITFGVMGVINMAHGEMVMLGAYTTFVVQEVIRTRYPGLFDYSLLIAVPLAFLVAGLIGV
jgi:urea transport system permease protein